LFVEDIPLIQQFDIYTQHHQTDVIKNTKYAVMELK